MQDDAGDRAERPRARRGWIRPREQRRNQGVRVRGSEARARVGVARDGAVISCRVGDVFVIRTSVLLL